jgi:cysteinyl-tRNA synthetase
LYIEPPTKWVRATDHIKEQIALIQELEDKGFTYKTTDGIYFDTSKFTTYADFAQLKISHQKEGARVEVNAEKRNASDFALWKFSPKGNKRSMEWKSPWGIGFPGWHIECSAMSMKYLGETFDIHAGGVDHIPVHHTNEIAQSEAATDKPLARVWMHGEFLVLKNEEKMAKSANNFLTLEKLEEKGFDPLAYRLFTFSAHYRQKLTFSFEALKAAQKALENLRGHIKMWDAPKGLCAEHEKRFFDALNDDLNMPQALAVMWEMIKSENPSSAKHASIKKFESILGLGLSTIKRKKIPAEISEILIQREKARKEKNFYKADELRAVSARKGFPIDDTPEGPIVR